MSASCLRPGQQARLLKHLGNIGAVGRVVATSGRPLTPIHHPTLVENSQAFLGPRGTTTGVTINEYTTIQISLWEK